MAKKIIQAIRNGKITSIFDYKLITPEYKDKGKLAIVAFTLNESKKGKKGKNYSLHAHLNKDKKIVESFKFFSLDQNFEEREKGKNNDVCSI